MSKLGVWSRLAIVLSAIWLAGGSAGLYLWTVGGDMHLAEQHRELCETLNREYPRARQDCWKDYNEAVAEEPRGQMFKLSALLVGGSLALAWLIYAAIYYTVRWVLAGRRSKSL
ncbi:hypothetical protein HZF05_13805 [Sphingomonas sp. CGMCC 1.13654]|uniref:Transmembrane protein n=1 Tax=Sphingomonas chungangi TaxID=2683589 RepID=A0A838L8C3_9SPHN|nr:hypothetical protein [Sphingomonas chungangi]MBA2935160.1 hypothetical protein [Sphingomonas chungangi]MVW57724.1 hypothetical protein [Sphingomonas chungangi]